MESEKSVRCKRCGNKFLVTIDESIALREQREGIAEMVRKQELVVEHIGPLYNAGWNECIQHIAATILAYGQGKEGEEDGCS